MADRYCSQCGGMLDTADKFCSKCGAIVNEGGTTVPRPTAVPPVTGSPPASLVVLDYIWACVAIFMGVTILIMVPGMMDMIMTSPDWHDIVSTFGEEGVRTMANILGVASVASGVLAAIAGTFTIKGNHYSATILALMMSSILGLVFIVGVFGFVVMYLTMNAKLSFKN